MLTCGQIMTQNPVCVSLDHRLHEVRSLFAKNEWRHVLVLDAPYVSPLYRPGSLGAPVGLPVSAGPLVSILSDRDVYRHVSPHVDSQRVLRADMETLDIPVHRMLSTRSPVVVTPDTPVVDACRLIVNKKISALPVVSSPGQAVGILSWKDLLNVCVPLLAQ